ncbi:MAG: PAS domain-containing protein [Candidatus Izemoplasmatales bacterium]
MDNRSLLAKYFPVADFIAQINGPTCEAIVHDLSDLQHSIVYIVNGHLSGRAVGGSITKYAFDLIMKNEDKSRDAFINYTGTNERTGKILRSSTLFIRNERRETVGLLCVNVDVTDLMRLRESLDGLIMVQATAAAEPERFDVSADEIVDDILRGALPESGPDYARSSPADKKDLVARLAGKGVFKFKGSIGRVATLLGISPQTLYRYLKELETK